MMMRLKIVVDVVEKWSLVGLYPLEWSKGGRKINAWWGRALRIEVAVDPQLSVQSPQIRFFLRRRVG
jgi:hypothetical protein